MPMTRPYLLIAGPPCAGKSTRARELGGIVLDWDDLFEEITGRPRYSGPTSIEMSTVESHFREREEHADIVIRLAASKQQRAIWRSINKGHSLVLATPPEICLERMRGDPRRDLIRTEASILAWWASYEPSTSLEESVERVRVTP